MSFNLASLSSEAVTKAPRIVLLGVEKIGKTTFSCGSRVENGQVVEFGLNKPVVVSVKGEEGADSIPVAKFPVAQSYDNVMEAMSSLWGEEHDFQTVVVDSVSTLYRRVKEAIQADPVNKMPTDIEYDRFNRGPMIAIKYFENLLAAADALREKKGMASVFIGHVKVKTITNPDMDPYDAYVWDLPDAIANLIYRWSDVILFASTKGAAKKDAEKFGGEHRRAIETAEGQRFVYTQKRLKHPGGGRGVYGRLPYELPFSWSDFTAAVNAAL